MTGKSRDFLAALALLIMAALLLSLFSPVCVIQQGSEALEAALAALRKQRQAEPVGMPSQRTTRRWRSMMVRWLQSRPLVRAAG